MIGSALQPEIHELIEAKDFATIKALVRDMEIHDLAGLLRELQGEDLAVVFRLLPAETAADIFGEFEVEQQEEVLRSLSTEHVAALLNDMPPDDRTELLEELPGEIAQRMLSQLRGQEAKIARSLLAYPEDSIGRLMTPEYVACRPDWTVEMVLRHIRRVASSKETANVLYVVDDHWKLLDEIALQDLVLAEPEKMVQDLMDNTVASLRAGEDQEEAVEIFKKYDAVVLPVVNNRGVLVGIVTVDDMLDVAEEEDTEDFQMMVGVSALEGSYFATGYRAMLRKRLPWLAVLFVAEIFTVLVISRFEASLDAEFLAMVIILVPLINACAGNAGSQMSGLMIRSIALQEADVSDWRRIFGLEVGRGLTMGLLLGAMALPTALLFGRPMHVAVAAATAMTAAVTVANLIGAMLPFVFKRLGLDPAATSGPFIASMMDLTSVLIYFSTAVAIFSVFS